MKNLLCLTLLFVSAIVQGQSICDKVILYDQMAVKGYKPLFHKLKPYDVKLIPDSTLDKMKREIIKISSPAFFAKLQLKTVRILDAAGATAWSWTNDPIVDNNSNPVTFFYAVIFEVKALKGTPFHFRIDVLKNGDLLAPDQIAFFKKGDLNIIGCEKIIALIHADTIQPFQSIESLGLAYSPETQAIVWYVNSVEDQQTGIKYFKQVNALTGEIFNRSFVNMNTPPELEILE